LTHLISLPWGAETLNLNLPEAWHLAGTFQPAAQRGVNDPGLEAERSLCAPVGSPRLSEMAHAGMKVALVIDDGSRPTPVDRVLPPVLAELERAGVRREEITLVPALGLHRPMTADEVAQRTGMGSGETPGLRWESHDCDDPARLANLGVTSRGTPVWVNKTVAEADLIVLVGCIEPHIIASFGGGYKNLIPGVAGRATIAHNHALNCTPDTFNMVGQPIERNPMRLDLEEGARMLKAPVFILNAVLNSALEVVRVVCGDPIAAHREGVRTSAKIYGAKVPALADVVITSSHPMDQDLRQGVKALANTVRAVKPGGVLITLVRANEGLGVFGLANRKLPVGRKTLKLLAPVILPLVPRLKLNGMGEEDRFFLYFALQAMSRSTLLMVAPTIPAEIHERLPFVQFIASPEEALVAARCRFPGAARVMVFPHGGMTYPILPENH
jgi:nickel-dependent lactate racemase